MLSWLLHCVLTSPVFAELSGDVSNSRHLVSKVHPTLCAPLLCDAVVLMRSARCGSCWRMATSTVTHTLATCWLQVSCVANWEADRLL